MTKLKRTKLKCVAFHVSEEDEADFRKEVEPIIQKYKSYRYQRSIQGEYNEKDKTIEKL